MKNIIPKPSVQEVNKYLDIWNKLDNYVLQERSLDKLFFGEFKTNNNIENILIKSSVLNDFYSTNIFSIFSVAKHILTLNIDSRLRNGDESLVNDIANITINNKKKRFYSFATKYCSHHEPELFPIYDDFVKKSLNYFIKTDKFAYVKSKDFKDYTKFKQILTKFKEYYNLNNFSLKDIDRYLWQMGKEFFPKKY
ncbi:MAG: hypothetical protein ACLRFG_01475 [Clostridia bacterium]